MKKVVKIFCLLKNQRILYTSIQYMETGRIIVDLY